MTMQITGATLLSNTQAIKLFMEANGGRKIEMDELKALPIESRKELGALCAAELDAQIKPELQ